MCLCAAARLAPHHLTGSLEDVVEDSGSRSERSDCVSDMPLGNLYIILSTIKALSNEPMHALETWMIREHKESGIPAAVLNDKGALQKLGVCVCVCPCLCHCVCARSCLCSHGLAATSLAMQYRKDYSSNTSNNINSHNLGLSH